MAATNPLDAPDLRDGTITSVRAQKNDPERVSVFIDDTFAFGLSAEIALKNGLRKGLAVSAAEQARLLDDEQRSRARSAALDFIGHRPRTEDEVRRRLIRRGFSVTLAEEAVEWLRDLGYLDDDDYARRFASERFETKGHGPARIRRDLTKRGASRSAIEAALLEVSDADKMRATVTTLAAARWERLGAEKDPRKRKKKVADYLARRGYDYGLIADVLQAISSAEPDHSDS